MEKLNRLSGGDFKKLQNSEVNSNHIILRFIGFDFNPDEITEKLGLIPFSLARKGEDYFVGKNKVKKTWEYNHWDYELKTKSNNFIGETINDFFETIIKPRFNLIKEISSNSEITRLIVVQYYYTGCNPGFTFKKEQVKILSSIDAEIDMDIYCLSED